MKLPVQSQPILRNTSNIKMAISSTNAVMVSGCGRIKKAICAATLAACAASCAEIGPYCLACFAAYGASDCVDCL